MQPFLLLPLVALSQQSSRPSSHPGALSKTPREYQRLVCYDLPSQRGQQLVATDYLSWLGDMDDRVESCCFTGIWILYAEQKYNIASPGASNWYGYGSGLCFDTPGAFRNVASSLRYTGAPDDMYHDTVNIYFSEHFNGDEEYTYTDRPQLNYDNRALSLIVTGCSSWTLYTERSYQGGSVCVGPGDSSCSPGFYPTSSSLGLVAGSLSSLRRGCYSSTWARQHGGQEGRVRGAWGATGGFSGGDRGNNTMSWL